MDTKLTIDSNKQEINRLENKLHSLRGLLEEQQFVVRERRAMLTACESDMLKTQHQIEEVEDQINELWDLRNGALDLEDH